jgi:5-methylcytosine-specific restriction endonuclease McrA
VIPPNEVVIADYESGMSTGAIAEKYSVAPGTVSSLLNRIGYKLRSAKEAAKVRGESGRWKPTSAWKGKKQPKEMVEKRLSKIRGENHYLWKGGESRRGYRDVVKKMKCDSCGSKLNLGIHHIDFDHYNDKPENLQVLCVSCHMSLHKTLYWDAKRRGMEPKKGNGPVGWKRGD